MPVKIVTDSTCDLPPSIIAEHEITVVPCYINMGEQSYLDGVELSRKAFYEMLPDCDPPPTTSAPGISTFIEVYERLAKQGATEIVSIHISAKLSNIVNVARLASEAIHSTPVTVVDSGQLTIGTGLQAWEAAKAEANGHTASEIADLITRQASHIYTMAALDTLEYLRRSGRLSNFQSLMGTLLKIKPLLTMNDDVIDMERVRTRQKALAWLIEQLEGLGPLQQLVLVHTNVPEAIAAFGEEIQHLAPDDGPLMAVDVTPVLGAHLGPGVVGFTCITQDEDQ